MNKYLDSQIYRPSHEGQHGMTLIVVLLALIVLTVFTGVVAMVMQFTLRFSAAESGEQNEFECRMGY